MKADIKNISSLNNEIVKLVISLQKARDRKIHGLFIIEGIRELKLAAEGGYRFHSLIFPAREMDAGEILKFLSENAITSGQHFFADEKVFKKIAYREEGKNVVAIAHTRDLRLEDLALPEKPLILVLENVEKPGNLGAILRTCDAAGVDAVILADQQTDIYNPNVVRSSLGTLFTNQLAVCSTDELIKYLLNNKIQFYITRPDAKIAHR